MKRIGNLYSQIYDIENLRLADQRAMKGKSNQYGVKLHLKNQESNILRLHHMLKNKTYHTSEYKIFKIYEPKEREVFQLPYFPDRITHHAILNILQPVFTNMFISSTYSCIKGKGIHAAVKDVKKVLKDIKNTQFCLKLDIKKFYPNVDCTILKQLLCRKFKDKDLLWLFNEIVDSTNQGIPIGNYLSQTFANFYLTYFDHWIKEVKCVKYYFRYADDIVILADNKSYLHNLLFDIRQYLSLQLKLIIKENYQIFPVSIRGIDFVGYRFYHTHTLLRKRIKQNFARAVISNKTLSIPSYIGWAKHCNSKHFIKKILN